MLSNSTEETCLKPIGALTQLIEETSIGDWALFVIAQSRAMRAEEKKVDNEIIIGYND